MQMIIIKTRQVSVDATLNSKGFSREGNKNDLVDLRAQVIIPFKIHGPVFSRTWWYFKYEPSLRKSIFPFSFSNPFLMRILISTFLARRYALNDIHHFRLQIRCLARIWNHHVLSLKGCFWHPIDNLQTSSVAALLPETFRFISQDVFSCFFHHSHPWLSACLQ